MTYLRAARLLSAALIIFGASPVVAGKVEDYVGRLPVRIMKQEACPILVVEGKMATRIVDTERVKGAASIQAPMAPEKDRPGLPVVYVTMYKNISDRSISAAEFRYEAFNAFDESLGSKTYSYAELLSPGDSVTVDDRASRLAEDISYYKVSVTRVRYGDGTTWVARPEIAPPPEERK